MNLHNVIIESVVEERKRLRRIIKIRKLKQLENIVTQFVRGE